MAVLKADGRDVELNDDGFLANPEDWCEEVVYAFAKLENINEVTSDHWKVILYLRDYYQRFEIAPMIRKLCKETGLSREQIDTLFPSGPAKGACRLAGLPKPTGCI